MSACQDRSLSRVPELTHGRVSLGDTTTHTTEQTSGSRVDTGTDDGLLDLSGSKQEDGTLGRGLNPSPRDQSLVDC